MNYYKVKVKHKQYEDIEKWFYLESISRERAIQKLKIIAATRELNFDILPETTLSISFREYETGLRALEEYL